MKQFFWESIMTNFVVEWCCCFSRWKEIWKVDNKKLLSFFASNSATFGMRLFILNYTIVFKKNEVLLYKIYERPALYSSSVWNIWRTWQIDELNYDVNIQLVGAFRAIWCGDFGDSGCLPSPQNRHAYSTIQDLWLAPWQLRRPPNGSAIIVCKIKTDAVVVFKDSIHFSFNHKKGVSLHWRRHVVRTKSCCKCSCFFAPYIHNISLHTVNVWCILTIMCFMSGNK